MENVHREVFRVRAYEVDPRGKASIQTVCNYLQEVAANHASRLGVSLHILFAQNLTWVLSRLHVLIARYPEWGEEVTVETWPSDAQGKFAIRDFLIFDQKGKRIAGAIASYMVVDLKKLQPIKIPDFILQVRRPRRMHALEATFPKLPQVKHADLKKTFNVRFSDLDVNHHVNNVRYIEWAAETIPQDIWRTHQINELEISFRLETKYGERIMVTAQKINDQFLHDIQSEKDQRDIARMRSRWVNKNLDR
jgi:medium-chain acyl-[acyl-carrier-protein] hydrolase